MNHAATRIDLRNEDAGQSPRGRRGRGAEALLRDGSRRRLIGEFRRDILPGFPRLCRPAGQLIPVAQLNERFRDRRPIGWRPAPNAFVDLNRAIDVAIGVRFGQALLQQFIETLAQDECR